MREGCLYQCSKTGDLLECVEVPNTEGCSYQLARCRIIRFVRIHDGETVTAYWKDRGRYSRFRRRD